MKKILIISHAMYIGGAERALIGLLDAIDKSEYEVQLFLLHRQGELMDGIPEGVTLLPEIKEYTCLAVPIGQVIKKGRLDIAYGRFVGKMKARRYVASHGMKTGEGVYLQYSHKYVKKYMPMISDTEYDLVISFLTPHYFGAEKIRAKKRVAWIHTDYSRLEIDSEDERAMWDAYDRIVSISDSVGEAFVGKFPSLEKKLIRVDNIISPEAIRASAMAERINFGEGETVILSCGRVTEGKNFRSIPKMCSLLLEAGHNVRWYIIGDGPDMKNVRESIEREGMTDRVILLGAKANPYPYIAGCDLYVQPSLYEGKAVAVREAQILGRPVIITDFPTAKSQLTEGFDGLIAPLDTEKCASFISELLKSPEKMAELSENCKNADYSNKAEADKLLAVIN